MTWYVVHVRPREDSQFEWGVCDRPNPQRPEDVLPCESREEARWVADRMNGRKTSEH